MLRISLLVLAAMAAHLPAAAQEGEVEAGQPARPDRPALEAQMRLQGLYFDNFFQAAAVAPQANVLAGRAELFAGIPVAPGLDLVAQASATTYDGFDPSSGMAGGVRWEAGRQSLVALTGYQWHAPRLDIGDVPGFADLFFAEAAYGIRLPADFDATALAEYYHQAEGSTGVPNDVYELGGALRYRGFGYIFSPEVGATRGERLAEVSEENFAQDAWWVSVRTLPVRSVYLHLRYRNRVRDYATSDPLSSNFGREDTRQQISATADVSLSDRWSWLVYYSIEDAQSSRVSRSFVTQTLSSGLAVSVP